MGQRQVTPMTSSPHPLGVHATSKETLESVAPNFLKAGLLRAQEKTRIAFQEIRKGLKEGMTEVDAGKLALQVFSDLGTKKHWHRPYIRMGSGTCLSFNEPREVSPMLKLNDPVYFDLGPVWPEDGIEYEGDYGDTFVLGENAEAQKCAEACRLIFSEAREQWMQRNTSGLELYEFIRSRATHRGYVLREDVQGHRIGDFPHHRFTKMNLSAAHFIPSDSLWVLEVQILDPKNRFGAFFEDILC